MTLENQLDIPDYVDGGADISSPGFVTTRTAAAISLDLFPGSFHRGTKLRAINLLLTYPEGCSAHCAYCGLQREREFSRDSFIRVDWPTFKLDDVIQQVNTDGVADHVERVCVSMITHERAFEDTLAVAQQFDEETDLLISGLITPTMLDGKQDLKKLKDAGVDMAGIAVDAATRELFERRRGAGVDAPHDWDHYWETIEQSAEVFGDYKTSVHLVVGLGETEEEMIRTIQRVHDARGQPHLFSFYPEPGSQMDGARRPSISKYHRIQLARQLIAEEHARAKDMEYDDEGRVTGYGAPRDVLNRVIDDGQAFMTQGCPGGSCDNACNRPYGNERPSEHLRNFPFRPDEDDVEEIRNYLARNE